MRTTLIILTLSLLISVNTFGQRIGFDEIDDSKVTPWIPKLEIEYQSVYHFGDSEMESEFILIIGLNNCYGQVKSSRWSEDATYLIWNFKNLTNIRIDGNKFYSDQTNGEFVIYDNGNDKIKGLKIFKPWIKISKKPMYEIGIKSYPVRDYFSGKFIQASIRLLSEVELRQMSKSDLKIMRNEIFARYGYRFREGGAMDNYFSKQDWYSPQHDNVNDFLTEIEKANITLIKTIEDK